MSAGFQWASDLGEHLAQNHGQTVISSATGNRMHLAAMQHTHQKMHDQQHFGLDPLQRPHPAHTHTEA